MSCERLAIWAVEVHIHLDVGPILILSHLVDVVDWDDDLLYVVLLIFRHCELLLQVLTVVFGLFGIAVLRSLLL